MRVLWLSILILPYFINAVNVYVRSNGNSTSNCGAANDTTACSDINSAFSTSIIGANRSIDVFLGEGTFTLCDLLFNKTLRYNISFTGVDPTTSIIVCTNPGSIGLYSIGSISLSFFRVGFSSWSDSLFYLNDSNNNVTLNNTIASFPDAPSGMGLFYVASGTIQFTSSIFANISSSSIDGAVLGTRSNSIVTVDASVFSDITGNQGGIFNLGSSSSLTIRSSRFSSMTNSFTAAVASVDSSSTLIIQNSNFSQLSVRGSAGAFSTGISARVTITSSNFFAISSGSSSSGGGVFFLGNNSQIQVSSSRFEENQEVSGNGGVFFTSFGTTSALTDSIFNFNSATKSGGVLSASSGTVSMLRCSFSSNQAKNNGGVMSLISGSSLTVDQTNFSSNSARDRGGVFDLNSASATISNSSFSANSATFGVGGTLASAKSPNITVVWSNFSLGNSREAGGVFSLENSTNSSFSYSSFQSTSSDYSNGGAIQVSTQSKIALTFCNFSSIHANKHGGAIYISGGTALITSTSFISCSSSTHGGAIYVDVTSSISLSIVQLSFNKASGNGGSLYLEGTAVNVDRSNFSSNLAANGGAIHASRTAVLVNCVLVGNNATSLGAAVYLDSNSDVAINGSNTEITSNSGLGSGAFYVLGKLSIRDAVITSNRANFGHGGAIYLKEGQVNITLSTLAKNIATTPSNTADLNQYSGYGGAIFVESGESSFYNTIFSSNNSSKFGGAIFVSSENDPFILRNVTFSYNQATSGGAIYSASFASDVSNLNFSHNKAQGKPVCRGPEGSGGAWFISQVTDCLLFNASSNIQFFNNSAMAFGGALAFTDAGCVNNSVVQHFTYGANSAGSYGKDFASISVYLNSSDSFVSLDNIEDNTQSLEVSLYDHFGQSVIEQLCQVSFNILFSSTKADMFIFAWENPYPTKIDPRTQLPFGLRFGSSSTFPALSSNVTVALELSISSSSELLDSLKWNFATNFAICPTGWALVNDEVNLFACQECVPGRFVNITSTHSACTVCPPGSISPGLTTSCDSCLSGTFSPYEASQTCTSCSAGRYASTNGSNTCIACPKGKYVSNDSSTSCNDCPQQATTATDGAYEIYQCNCLNEFYGEPWQGTSCQKCPRQVGVVCNANSTVPFVTKGFYRDPASITHVLQCIPLLACLETGFANATQCETGYTGWLCGSCIQNQYYKLDKKCVKCGDPAFTWVVLILLSIGFIAVAYKISNPAAISNIPHDIRVTVTWMQTVSLYTKISSNWPPELSIIFRFGSILMILPIIFFAVLFPLVAFYSRYKQKKVAQMSQETQGPSIFTRLIYIVVFLISTMYTMLAITVFRPMQCLAQPDGTFTMIMSPTESCYEGTWQKNYPSVVLFALVFLGIAPGAIIIEFWRYRGNTDSLKFDWLYGALTRPYRKKFFWWELVATLKKIIFVVLVDVLADVTQSARFFYLICFLMLFMGMENTFRPFKTAELNGLNALWSLVCIVLLLCESTVFAPATMSSERQLFFAILMLLLFFLTLALSLYRTLYGLYLSRKGKKSKHTGDKKDQDEVVWAKNPVQFLAKLGGEVPAEGENDGQKSPVPITKTQQVEVVVLYPSATMHSP